MGKTQHEQEETNNTIIKVKKYEEGFDGRPELIDNQDVSLAIKALADIKEKEENLKKAKESFATIIEDFHFATGARSFSLEGVGSVTAYLGTSSKFDKTKMGLYLVEHGVKAKLVEDAITHATKSTTNSKTTVKFEAKW